MMNGKKKNQNGRYVRRSRSMKSKLGTQESAVLEQKIVKALQSIWTRIVT